MKRQILTGAAALALAMPQTVIAQDDTEPTAAEMSAIGAMSEAFRAEPLTTEQEARLPAAEGVVAKVFPPGTYREMMDKTLEPMMDGITQSVKAMPMAQIAEMTGMSAEEVDELGEATMGEVMDIVDPAFDRRIELTNTMMFGMINDLVDEIEPAFRAGLARAYAVHFTESELADLSTFFATPTGSKYAPASFMMFTDPQVMSVMADVMPAMMERMPAAMAGMREEMEALPKPKTFGELNEAERKRLAEVLGVPVSELRKNSIAADEDDVS